MKNDFIEALLCLLPVPVMARFFHIISWKTFLEILLIVVVSVYTTLKVKE